MAQNYTRQSSFSDGDTITSSLFNNEYNQIVNAFTYSSSSDSSTGHKHDGNAGQGGNIPQIGDIDFNNKIVVDGTNNRWGVFVEVSGSAVEQIRIQDGGIVPVTDSDVDLGTSSLYFKAAYIDAITTTGNVAVGGNLTVTGTTTFNGGTITMGDAATDNVVFGANVDSHIIPDDDGTYDLGSSTQEWKDIYIDGTAYVDAINFNGTAITATAAELNILDGVTSTAAELNILDGVTSTAAELNILDGVTATATELNLLDGVTATTAELNILDGVTATATEINLLDGVTSTTAELNILDGVTSTAAELNILDGKAFLDEDDMSSNSATGIPSQQSVKAYVDAQQDTVDTFAEVLALSNTTSGTDIAVSTGDDITFADSSKAIFGAGSDLQIYHDGDTSYISHNTTGTDLVIEATSPGDDVIVRAADDLNFRVNGNENGIVVVGDGATSLYHANSQKLATTATGIDVTGVITTDGMTTSADINFGDSDKAVFGAGSDLQIYHTGTESIIKDSGTGDLNIEASDDIRLRQVGGAQNYIYCHDGGEVILYHAGSEKLATTSTGINVTNTATMAGLAVDNGTQSLSSTGNNLQFNRDGGSSYIEQAGTGSIALRTDAKTRSLFASNGDISFYEDTGTTAKLFWDASAESLGIGTTSPAREVHVTTAGQNGVRLTSTAFGADFGLLSSVGGTNGFGIYDYTASAYRFNIDSSGNVGIGTSSPSAKLTSSGVSGTTLIQAVGVDSNGFADVEIKSTGTSGGSRLYFSDTAAQSGSIKYSHSNNSMQFSTAATERMRIDASGNVGIGAVPEAWASGVLGVDFGTYGSLVDGTNVIVSRNAYYDGAWKYKTTDHASSYWQGSAGEHIWQTAASGTADAALTWSESMRIDASGNVGIGTDAPDRTLSVKGAAGVNIPLTVESAAGQPNCLIAMRDPNTTSSYAVAVGADTDDLILRAGGLERVRIDSSGNLLVGKTSADSTTVGTQIEAAGAVAVTRDGSTSLYLNRKTSDGTIADFRKDGASIGSLGTEGGNLVIDGSTATGKTGIEFSGAEWYPRESGANSDGVTSLGDASNRFKDLYLSSGVKVLGDGASLLTQLSLANASTDVASGSSIDFQTGSGPTTTSRITSAYSSANKTELIFSTYNSGLTESMRISDGNLLVGTTSTPSATQAGFMFTGDQLYTSAGAATTTNYQVRFYNGNGLVGAITTDGSATAYLTSSDQRLKENIRDADDAGSKVDAIQVRKFDWKADGAHQDYGMIAQELIKVAPEAVSAPEDP